MSSNHAMTVETLLDDKAPLQRFNSGAFNKAFGATQEGKPGDCEAGDDVPPLGREISCEGLMFNSRQNSNNFSLSREVSLSFLCDTAPMTPMTREISISFLLEAALPMSRENSKSFARESSTVSFGLGRESSFSELPQIVTAAAVHDFLSPPVPANGPTIPVLATAPTTAMDTTLASAHTSAATTQPAERPGRGAPRPPGAGSRRGLHVKGRPEMQQTARDGAVHWSQQLKQVRAVWAARAARCPDFGARFQAQLDLSLGRVKSKQECLLRTLQLAAADGLIVAAPFAAGGFFGWTRFDVAAGRAGDFRRAVEGLFPAGFREDTLKETFRRAGLVPDRWQWALGWAGQVPWLFTKDRQ